MVLEKFSYKDIFIKINPLKNYLTFVNLNICKIIYTICINYINIED